jgi:hypothetical protein
MALTMQREPTTATRTIIGGHLVARALKAEGLEAIFSLCGGHIMDIYDGCTSVQSPHLLATVSLFVPFRVFCGHSPSALPLA